MTGTLRFTRPTDCSDCRTGKAQRTRQVMLRTVGREKERSDVPVK